MHTGLVSEDPPAVNTLTRPAHCRILQKRTFVLHFHYFDLDRA